MRQCLLTVSVRSVTMMDEEVRRVLQKIKEEGEVTLEHIWDVQRNEASQRSLPRSVKNRIDVLIFGRGYAALESTLKAMLSEERATTGGS